MSFFRDTQKPIAVLDIEATGLDISRDRIVSLAIVRLEPDLPEPKRAVFYCNPEMEMSAEVIAIHGISNEMARQFKPLLQHATHVLNALQGCDLAGFNLLHFDLPLLWEELHRCGYEFDMEGRAIIDAGVIFKRKEPRTLEAAVKRYAGRDHAQAHNALADALATMEVLIGQRGCYEDIAAMTRAQLAEFSCTEKRIDLAGKLVRDADGDAVYHFGNCKGQKVRDNPGFAYWMLNKDFPVNTLNAVRAELDRINAV